MNNKKILYSILLVVFIISIIVVNRFRQKYFYNQGYIQGTTYHITYQNNTDLHKDIDKILHNFDTSLSTYIPNSIISRINQNDSSAVIDKWFKEFFNVSQEVSEQTQGAFDITVAPIVNAWGFGFSNKSEVDSLLIDSLLTFTSYKKVRISGNKIIKDDRRIMLDANAIAQGQSVDVICAFFEKSGIHNYLVDIGGEIRTKGKNPKNLIWKVGIDKPIENSTESNRKLEAVLNISDKAIATSGNYRKFYIKNGIKYSHTINPLTGYPVNHNLLSATVITDKCIYADAYATAFMVMGIEKAKIFLLSHPDIKVFFIYTDAQGNYKEYASKDLKIESLI